MNINSADTQLYKIISVHILLVILDWIILLQENPQSVQLTFVLSRSSSFKSPSFASVCFSQHQIHSICTHIEGYYIYRF